MLLGDSDPELLDVFLAAVDQRRAARAPRPQAPPAPQKATTQAVSFAAALDAASRR